MAASSEERRESCVKVTVLRGRGLMAMDKTGTSDPFVVVKLDAQEGKTSIMKKTLEPTWEESFILPVYNPRASVEVTMFDWNMTGHKYMGSFTVSVSELPAHNKYMRRWYRLTGKTAKDEPAAGEVELLMKLEIPTPVQPFQFMPVVPNDWWVSKQLVFDPSTEYFLDPPLKEDCVRSDLFTTVQEDPLRELNWYARIYSGNAHENYIANHADIDGVVIASILATTAPDVGTQYWVILWRRIAITHHCVELPPNAAAPTLQDILTGCDAALGPHAKHFAKLPSDDAKIVQALLKLENPDADQRFKLGVLFAKDGQVKENDMYANETGSPAFEEFLNLLGDRVTLRGFTGYSAQLDTKNDNSGLTSVYRPDFKNHQVMYHVSTLLQYDPTDEQKVQRKRFIGNDIVMIVFMDGPTTYCIKTMTSQYTNFVAVVQPDPANPGKYLLSCGSKRGLRFSGPALATRYGKDGAFADFLLTKCLNGNRATYVSPEFTVRDRRTRKQLLDTLHAEVVEKIIKTKKPKVCEDVLPLTALTANPPQAFTVDTLLGAVPMRVICLATWNEFTFFGTSDGIYSVRDGLALKVGPFDNVVQIIIEESLDVMFVRTGPPNSNLWTVVLSEMCTPQPQMKISVIPHSRNTDTFACGVIGVHTYLCAVIDCDVVIFLCSLAGVFTKVETLHFKAPVSAILTTPNGIVVAASHDVTNAPMVLFYDVEMFLPNVIYTSPNPTDVAMGLFLFPMGLLLCTDKEGILIKPDAKPMEKDRIDMKWVGAPVHFAQFGPFIIVSYRSFLEVRSYINGALIETHFRPSPNNYTCHGPAVLIPSWSSSAERTVLYKLTPIHVAASEGGREAEPQRVRAMSIKVGGNSFLAPANLRNTRKDTGRPPRPVDRMGESAGALGASGDSIAEDRSEEYTSAPSDMDDEAPPIPARTELRAAPGPRPAPAIPQEEKSPLADSSPESEEAPVLPPRAAGTLAPPIIRRGEESASEWSSDQAPSEPESPMAPVAPTPASARPIPAAKPENIPPAKPPAKSSTSTSPPKASPARTEPVVTPGRATTEPKAAPTTQVTTPNGTTGAVGTSPFRKSQDSAPPPATTTTTTTSGSPPRRQAAQRKIVAAVAEEEGAVSAAPLLKPTQFKRTAPAHSSHPPPTSTAAGDDKGPNMPPRPAAYVRRTSSPAIVPITGAGTGSRRTVGPVINRAHNSLQAATPSATAFKAAVEAKRGGSKRSIFQKRQQQEDQGRSYSDPSRIRDNFVASEEIKYEELKGYNTRGGITTTGTTGLNSSNLEAYLSTAEFTAVFEMDRAEFSQLPRWRRDNLKRDRGLF